MKNVTHETHIDLDEKILSCFHFLGCFMNMKTN